MLVISRKVEEVVVIDGRFKVKVLEIRGDRVRLGFDFPPFVAVNRKEIQDRIDAEEVDGRAPER